MSKNKLIEEVSCFEFDGKIYKTRQEAIDYARYTVIMRLACSNGIDHYVFEKNKFRENYDQIMKELSEIV